MSEAKPCPICGKPADPRLRPFCSTRCADVDLQSWLTDRYAIPVDDDEERPDEEVHDEDRGPRAAGQPVRGFL